MVSYDDECERKDDHWKCHGKRRVELQALVVLVLVQSGDDQHRQARLYLGLLPGRKQELRLRGE